MNSLIKEAFTPQELNIIKACIKPCTTQEKPTAHSCEELHQIMETSMDKDLILVDTWGTVIDKSTRDVVVQRGLSFSNESGGAFVGAKIILKSQSQTLYFNVAIDRLVIIPNARRKSEQRAIKDAYEKGILVPVFVYTEITKRNYDRGPHRIVGFIGGKDALSSSYIVLLRIDKMPDTQSLLPIQIPSILYRGKEGKIIRAREDGLGLPNPEYTERAYTDPAIPNKIDDHIENLDLSIPISTTPCIPSKKRQRTSSTTTRLSGRSGTPEDETTPPMRPTHPTPDIMEEETKKKRMNSLLDSTSSTPACVESTQNVQITHDGTPMHIEPYKVGTGRRREYRSSGFEYTGSKELAYQPLQGLMNEPTDTVWKRIENTTSLQQAERVIQTIPVLRKRGGPSRSIRLFGHRYDSVLEVRWAVFMHVLGIRYVPMGRTINFGRDDSYTPDFVIPEDNLCIEIKPFFPSEEALVKAQQAAEQDHCNFAILYGDLSSPVGLSNGSNNRFMRKNPYKGIMWASGGKRVPGEALWIFDPEKNKISLRCVCDYIRDRRWAHWKIHMAYEAAYTLIP